MVEAKSILEGTEVVELNASKSLLIGTSLPLSRSTFCAVWPMPSAKSLGETAGAIPLNLLILK